MKVSQENESLSKKSFNLMVWVYDQNEDYGLWKDLFLKEYKKSVIKIIFQSMRVINSIGSEQRFRTKNSVDI